MQTTYQTSRSSSPARFLALSIGIALAGLTGQTTHAANRNWDGSDSQAWETAANWGENAVPVAGDVVFIATTSSLPNYPVISTGTQAASELWFGAFNGNPSRLDITGGSLTLSTRFVIAPDNASVVTLNQSGGDVAFTSAGNALVIGQNGGDATYNMSGGTLSSLTWFNIGDSGAGGTATFNLTSGTVNAATSSGAVNIGDQASATGVLNVSGGAFNSTNTTANGGIVVGNHWTGAGTNTGTLTVSGSGLVNTGTSTAGNGLKLASGAASVGTVNLDGGTIATAKVQKGSGSGTFNFNGGTLRATAANASFMTGLTNAYVKAGGAVIDSNGFNVTIGQALLSGTTGDGGLTKNGAGTLTLGGANTYNGATNVNVGTLAVGASGSISSSPNVNIAAGATFDTTAQSFTMLGSQTFKFTLDAAGAGSAGLLNAAALNITAGVVDFATIGTLDDSAYVIASYTAGNLTGSSFATVNNLPSGYTIDYGYNGGTQIALTVVPEPGAFAMLLGGVGMLAVFRRRRA